MPSPSPGMDPYLENPAFWPDVHQSLITYLRDAIQSQIRLRAPDNDVPIDLQAILAQCYANSGYENVIDYRTPPTVQLSVEEAA